MKFAIQIEQADILLLACYELGHQPLSLAGPLAVLQDAGFASQAIDLSIQDFPVELAATADFAAISVPMHTALTLGVGAAKRIRELNPNTHICFFGLYAWLNHDHLLSKYAESVIGGEYEQPLLELIRTLDQGGAPGDVEGVSTFGSISQPNLQRGKVSLPERSNLPPLSNYAHYTHNGSHTPSGYVEASRGCLHTCKHCPIVPVYEGRFFITPLEVVLADIRQQVASGAGHITFGDPDFLNGPGHALKVTRALHDEFPQLTFNFTTKVEHILEKRALFPELQALGCSFIVSAFESTSNATLERLDKGHTLADMETALEILDQAKISIQPTWMPFTPWTNMEDYLHMLNWIRKRGLISNTPAVQLAVRMLVPPKSALLDHPDIHSWLGELNKDIFSYSWTHTDPHMDALQEQVAELAENHTGKPHSQSFTAIEKLAYKTAGLDMPEYAAIDETLPAPPRLTEDWFC